MKKVSIIIPCHNCHEWVYQSWKSLKSQTMGLDDIECIFVDDCSDDEGKTLEVLNRIEQEAPENVMIIPLSENLRQGGARNVGMQYASGEYMLFLDSDDLYRPETCQELYDLAKKYDADIVQFKHDVIWRDYNDASIPEKKERKQLDIIDLDDTTRRTFLIGKGDCGCTNKFYRLDMVRKLNPQYAEHMIYEEPKFVYPLFLIIDRIVMVDDGYYIWRKHAGSTMTSELGPKLLDHPRVQLETLEEIMQYGDLYLRYAQEVQFKFFHSYYYETLFFAFANKGNMTLELYHLMQETCKALIPDIAKNKYVLEREVYQPLAESINIKVDSTEQMLTLLVNLLYITDGDMLFKYNPGLKPYFTLEGLGI